jgi:hypothetical protein
LLSRKQDELFIKFSNYKDYRFRAYCRDVGPDMARRPDLR